MKARLLALLAISIAAEGFAATGKKDFKGLFGSYRREKYTENEGRDSDFGIDILLATALPVSGLVKTDGSSTSLGDINNASIGSNMQGSTFFSGELGVFFTLSYNWEIFGNLGYYSYDTRVQNTLITSTGNQPLYIQYNMTMIPAVLGVKYRFGRSDIVPYIGVAGGMSFVTRQGSYDYSNVSDTHKDNALTGQASVGLEFYIASRTGLRLEASAMYVNLPSFVYNPSNTTSPVNTPAIKYQASPLLMRYSSGLFVLF